MEKEERDVYGRNCKEAADQGVKGGGHIGRSFVKGHRQEEDLIELHNSEIAIREQDGSPSGTTLISLLRGATRNGPFQREIS